MGCGRAGEASQGKQQSGEPSNATYATRWMLLGGGGGAVLGDCDVCDRCWRRNQAAPTVRKGKTLQEIEVG